MHEIKKANEIKTGLFETKNKKVLESVIGQLSDGIWENSKKWRNIGKQPGRKMYQLMKLFLMLAIFVI